MKKSEFLYKNFRRKRLKIKRLPILSQLNWENFLFFSRFLMVKKLFPKILWYISIMIVSIWIVNAEINISNPQNSSSWFMIMDENDNVRNIYQRWNNYAFPSEEWYNIDFYNISHADASWYWPNRPYANPIFYTDYDRTSPSNSNLWWWWDDNQSNNYWLDLNNSSDRRWPCPLWYHIPSVWEWSMVFKYRCDSNPDKCTSNNMILNSWLYYNDQDDDIWMKFAQDFGISITNNYRDHLNPYVSTPVNYAEIRTSSPSLNDSNKSFSIYIDTSSVYTNSGNYRGNAISLRCFKDFYGYVIKFNSNWWSDIENQKVGINTTTIEPSINPTKSWYIFRGWFTDNWTFINKYEFWDTLPWDITLYAKWEKAKINGVVTYDTWAWISYIDTNGKEFTWIWTITINWENPVIILDRDLWAEISWTWTQADWYHFQWWNNYWFKSCKENNCTNFPWWEVTTSTKVDASWYWWNNPYISSWFITSNDWNWDSSDSTLWNESDQSKRQWPCPAWYHIPNTGELNKLIKYRVASYTWNWWAINNSSISIDNGLRWIYGYWEDIRNDLLLPYAWRRTAQWKVEDKTDRNRSFLWSTSPINSSQIHTFKVSDDWFWVADVVIDEFTGVTIYVAGDSTVQTYDDSLYPQTGRGQVLSYFFDSTRVRVRNAAIWGRSSKTFIEEGRLDKILKEAQEWDYLFVQFGHNDRNYTKPDRYVEQPEFSNYIQKYIDAGQKIWMNVVLVSPMNMNGTRNVFWTGNNNYNARDMMRNLAIRNKIPFVDLNTKSYNMNNVTYKNIPDYVTRYLYRKLEAWEYPNYPDGVNDGTTHFQEMWSMGHAWMICDELKDNLEFNTNLSSEAKEALTKLVSNIKKRYTIEVRTNLTNYSGLITQTQYFPVWSPMTLRVTPNGHTFEKWVDDDCNEISEDMIYYGFKTKARDITYTAMFNGGSVCTPIVHAAEDEYSPESNEPSIRTATRVDGVSIRCFKDTYAEWNEPYILSYETNWWTKIQSQTILSWEKWYLPWYTTHKTWMELVWWFNSEWTEKYEFESNNNTFSNLVMNSDIEIYAKWWYRVTFLDQSGNVVTWTVVEEWKKAIAPELQPQTWYEIVWYDEWWNLFDIEDEVITWDINLIAGEKAIIYTITFDTDGGNQIAPITWIYNSDIVKPSNPTKAGFTFKWWNREIPSKMPAEDMTIKALWNKNWGWWGWWGWWWSPAWDNTWNATTWDSSSTWIIVNTGSEIPQNQTWEKDNDKINTTENNWINETINNNAPEWNWYSEEFNEAYEFAYKNWITTMPTIQKAQMNSALTRIAMAKMLSYYAINVLWQKPDENRINKFNDVSDKLDKDYDNWVTLAYQLWIMWINMLNNKFRPNDEVTRAEFGTALSRMLYSTPDGKPYYSTHLEKLKSEWIITNDNAKMKELRGYVMIMLMRSAK